MRLNWFSPLPPARTDIAHYSARIAPALMRRFEVVFWSDLEADPAALPEGAQLRAFDPRLAQGRDFFAQLFQGLNVYNLGNDARFHAAIAALARRVPGLVILHDTRLHHFVYESARHDDPPFAGYVALARATYGERGAAAARAIVEADGRTIERHVAAMPFVEPFLEGAFGGICHSPAAAAEVRALSDAPLLTLPLPFRSLAETSPTPRVWSPPWRFVLFGYVGSNRRLESILRALAAWRDAPDYRFDIYGSLWNPGLVDALIRESGLHGRVNVHGFVPERELDAAIAGAHLAFNLRQPTMGEASGGILRSWAGATPTLVTDAGWYASLPDSIVRKISPDDELTGIRQALDELVRTPARFAAMGEAARRHLETAHSPEVYAERLEAALADRSRLASALAIRRLRRRVEARVPTIREAARLSPRAEALIAGVFGG